MHTIQRFIHQLKKMDSAETKESFGKPYFIRTKNDRTHTCTPPKCAVCVLSKMERYPTTITVGLGSKYTYSFYGNDLQKGDQLSID